MTSDKYLDLKDQIGSSSRHGHKPQPCSWMGKYRDTQTGECLHASAFDPKDLKVNIKDLDFDDEKPVLRSEAQRFIFDKIVIACGAVSKRLTDKLHENIPMDTERGYHIHFKGCDNLISRPVVYQNRGFGMTPMDQGLRVVGTVEFGGLDNPLTKSRIKNLILNEKDINNYLNLFQILLASNLEYIVSF